MDDLEALEDQWADLIDVAEFVSDRLLDLGHGSNDPAVAKQCADAISAVRSTQRQARKVKAIMGWQDDYEVAP